VTVGGIQMQSLPNDEYAQSVGFSNSAFPAKTPTAFVYSALFLPFTAILFIFEDAFVRAVCNCNDGFAVFSDQKQPQDRIPVHCRYRRRLSAPVHQAV